jgi:hypothetical protein
VEAKLTTHGIAEDDSHALLRIDEAARFLRIGRSLAYKLAHEYLATDGASGLPVLRFGTCLRVPRWALTELVTIGRVVQLTNAAGRPTG